MSSYQHERENRLRAELLYKVAHDIPIPEYKQILQSEISKLLLGYAAIPLPAVERPTYSAGEAGAMLGISANKFGRLTKAHGLRTEEHGKVFYDKSRYSAKEVETLSVLPGNHRRGSENTFGGGCVMNSTYMEFVEKVAADMELAKELMQILYNRNAKNLDINDKSTKMRDLITSYAMNQPGNLALIDIIAEKIKKIFDLAIKEEERLCEPIQVVTNSQYKQNIAPRRGVD